MGFLRWLYSFIDCEHQWDCKKRAAHRCERCGKLVCADHFFCGYICENCMNY